MANKFDGIFGTTQGAGVKPGGKFSGLFEPKKEDAKTPVITPQTGGATTPSMVGKVEMPKFDLSSFELPKDVTVIRDTAKAKADEIRKKIDFTKQELSQFEDTTPDYKVKQEEPIGFKTKEVSLFGNKITIPDIRVEVPEAVRTETPKAVDPERVKQKNELTQQLKNYEIAFDIYDRAAKKDPTKDPQFFSDLKEGLSDAVKEPGKLIPFLGSLASLEENWTVLKAVEKKQAGKELTKTEDAILSKFEAQNLPQNRGTGYLVGATIAQLPTYAAEFALTGGVYTATKEALVVAAEKALPRVVANKLAKQAVNVGASIVASAVQGSVNVPAVANRTAEYMLPSADIVQGENGDYMVTLLDNKGDSFGKAFAKAFGTNAVDYITERAGVVVDKPLDYLAKATLGKYFAKMGIVGDSKALQAIKKGIAWNGIIGEVFEEELSELGQAPIEQRDYKAPFLTPEGTKRLWVETLSIGIFGGTGQLSDKTIQSIYQNRGEKPPVVSVEEEGARTRVEQEKEQKQAQEAQGNAIAGAKTGVPIEIKAYAGISPEGADSGFRTPDLETAKGYAIDRGGKIAEYVEKLQNPFVAQNQNAVLQDLITEGNDEAQKIFEKYADVLAARGTKSSTDEITREIDTFIQKELSSRGYDSVVYTGAKEFQVFAADKREKVKTEKVKKPASAIERAYNDVNDTYAERVDESGLVYRKPTVKPRVVNGRYEGVDLVKLDKELTDYIGTTTSRGDTTIPYVTQDKLDAMDVMEKVALVYGKEAVPAIEALSETPTAKPKKQKKVEKKAIDPVAVIKKILPKKTNLPILQEAMVRDGFIYATDLDMYAKLKTDLPDGMYKIVGKEFVKTKTDATDFPAFQTVEGKAIAKGEAEQLEDVIGRASISASTSDMRPELKGVHFSIGKDGIEVAATDAFRLFKETIEAETKGSGEFIIAGKFSEVLPAIGNVIDITEGKESIGFKSESGEITVKKIEGSYPKFKGIYPAYTSQFQMKRADFLSALKELKPYTNKSLPVVVVKETKAGLKLIAEDKERDVRKEIVVEARKSEIKSEKEAVDGVLVMQVVGDNVLQFNVNYLTDAAKSFEGDDFFMSQSNEKNTPYHFSATNEFAAPILTQKERVKRAVAEKPKTAGEVAEETGVLEPNVRRILGVGAKEGTFERVDKGVYILRKDGKDVAYIHAGDALEVLPKLAADGFKADMIFLDIPYKTPAVIGGNRGIKYAYITPEDFKGVVSAVSEIARDENTPIFHMYSQAKSGMKEMQKYNDIILDAFKPIARGEYTKLQLDGVTRVRNMRGEIIEPEGIMLLSKSGALDPALKEIKDDDIKFKLIRPRGYQTEKPAAMLKALIEMTTEEGDVVLDPFAGSGVTAAEAVRSGRKAVAIEKSEKAVEENIKPKIEEAANRPPEKVETEEIEKPRRAPSGLASAGAQPIGSFERIGEESTPAKEFKLFEKVEELIRKYAQRIGEGYLPRNARGVFYPETQNIRVGGMNDISVAVHEIAHYLDVSKTGLTSEFMKVKGYASNGNPIYEGKTLKFRKALTGIYTEYYPGGKPDHELKKRLLEGFATFIQKYAEQPKTITEKYPLLVNELLKETGTYYRPIFKEIIDDVRGIVRDYQGLQALDKIGARVTSGQANVDKESFMNVGDKIRTEVADNIYPYEKLAKLAGVEMTKADPSLWARLYNNANAIIINNFNGDRGYWGWRDGNFKKISDSNWKTLISSVGEQKDIDAFGYYLVARREHFDYKNLENMKKRIDEGDPSVTLRQEYKELRDILQKDGFTKEEVDAAYLENKDRFAEAEKLFDELTNEDLKFLNAPEIMLLDNDQYRQLTAQEGYASFKRQFYDEIAGAEESGTGFRIGKTKVSSLIGRRGSSRTIINPVYSGIKNHAEVVKKGLKQAVYNRLLDISPSFPQLFQKQELKSIPRPGGGFEFPQDKDPNIIMARQGYKRVPFLVDTTIKRVADEVLNYQNIGYFEKVLIGANRFFTKGTTGLFPGFAITNYAIDQITAVAQTQHNYVPIYTPLKEIAKMVQDGKGGEDYKYFVEYLVLGGERQTFVGWQDLPPNQLFEKIKAERRGLLKFVDGLNKGMDVLAIPSKWSEIATRATEYIKSRKAGDPQVVSMEKAGRITAPFHHVGRLGGGRIGQVFIKSIPFFNPSIQVMDQAIRSGIEDEKGRVRYGFTVAAVTAAMASSFYLMLQGASDDQKDLYLDLQPEELAKYIWLPNPSDSTKLIRIRIPDQMAVFGTLFNMVLADNLMNADYSFGDYVDAATSFLPQQFQFNDPARMFLSWIPQMFKPSVLTIANVKDYPKVIPLESISKQRIPSEFRTQETTTPVAKALGQTELAKTLNLSPIKIDYLITGYFGRASGFALGKPGIYNPLQTVNREYYFTSGRRLQNYYDIKKENDENYTAMNQKLRTFTEKEKDGIRKLRTKLNRIDGLLEDYRKADLKESEAKTKHLRSKILQLVAELPQK